MGVAVYSINQLLPAVTPYGREVASLSSQAGRGFFLREKGFWYVVE